MTAASNVLAFRRPGVAPAGTPVTAQFRWRCPCGLPVAAGQLVWEIAPWVFRCNMGRCRP